MLARDLSGAPVQFVSGVTALVLVDDVVSFIMHLGEIMRPSLVMHFLVSALRANFWPNLSCTRQHLNTCLQFFLPHSSSSHRGLSGFEGGSRAGLGHVSALHRLRLHVAHLGQIHARLRNDAYGHPFSPSYS